MNVPVFFVSGKKENSGSTDSLTRRTKNLTLRTCPAPPDKTGQKEKLSEKTRKLPIDATRQRPYSPSPLYLLKEEPVL
jgi:hypothetical protein